LTGRTGTGRGSESRQDRFERAALRYLAAHDRTEAQMTAYLSRRGAPSARIRELLEQFRTRGYLNDRAYALRWAQARIARRPMGSARLEAELESKGFPSAAIADAIRTVYKEASPRELAGRALRQRERTGTRLTAARKAGLLRQSGFEEELIEELLGLDDDR
jgi:regulatory protein